MRFEPVERDGLARIGILEVDDVKYRTPAVAFVDTARCRAPNGALKLRRLDDDGKGGLIVAPSGFSRGPSMPEEGAHLRPGFRGSPYAEHEEKSNFALPDQVSSLLLDSRMFVETIERLKTGPDLLRPAYCSMMGLPHRLAFLAYCGFDVFDSVPLIMAAENDHYLTTTGILSYEKLTDLPCSCEACSSGRRGREELIRHNYSVAENELRLVRHAISEGALRELVESRVRSDPWLVQNLRLLDLEHYNLQEVHAAVKGMRFHAGSKESLSRPDVVRWRKRLEQRYRKPDGAKMLLLIPCSAKKPYSLSQSHMRFRQTLWETGMIGLVHEVIVTSPLGLVPRELELFYPAQDYDIPVTGHWDRDEKKMIEDMVAWLVSTQRYDLVISHLGDEREPVNSVLRDFVDTSEGRPAAKESLKRLGGVLLEHGVDSAKTSLASRLLEDVRSICRYQFGQIGERLCDDATITGRWPNLRIVRAGKQLGMLTGDRGMISLTMEGGRVLTDSREYCVEIDDFLPKGNLFAIGVERAGREIRIGDDVAIVHDKDVRAVGVARMTPVEMELAERGEAVHIRHAL